MNPEIEKDLALLRELETSIKLLQTGLREVQGIGGGNSFYHVALLTLANGFERLMKVIICLGIHERTKQYPIQSPWSAGKEGHNLVSLLDTIIREYFPDDYVTKIPAAQEDVGHIRTNTRLRELLGLLSDFGQAARYYNLDVVVGRTPTTDDPESTWKKLELAILQEIPDYEALLQNDPDLSQIYKHLNQCIVSEMERLARALSRLLTIGKLGQKAKQFSSFVYPFLMLRDDQLGNVKY